MVYHQNSVNHNLVRKLFARAILSFLCCALAHTAFLDFILINHNLVKKQQQQKKRSWRTVGCMVLVLGVGRCAFRPPRVEEMAALSARAALPTVGGVMLEETKISTAS